MNRGIVAACRERVFKATGWVKYLERRLVTHPAGIAYVDATIQLDDAREDLKVAKATLARAEQELL